MSRDADHSGKVRITRRRLLQLAPATVAVSGLACLGASNSEAAEKVAKKAVNYQDSPMDGKRCAGCTFFEEGGSCERVKGEISPDGWCALWTPKEG